MSPQPQLDPLNQQYEECLRLHKCWLWFLVLGISLMVLGFVAIGYQVVTTITTVLVLGYLLLAGGVVQVVNAFLGRSWGGFFLHLLAAVLHLIVGVLMIEKPLRAAEILTLILAVAFLVGGSLRIVVVLTQRFSAWPWVLLNGVVTLLLGILIWRQWPESSLWVIGLFVGIDLIFNGWSWVMLGLAVKAIPPGAPEPGSAAS
jgi:uncharacterized membrane protein HdeD (DUF308 family)